MLVKIVFLTATTQLSWRYIERDANVFMANVFEKEQVLSAVRSVVSKKKLLFIALYTLRVTSGFAVFVLYCFLMVSTDGNALLGTLTSSCTQFSATHTYVPRCTSEHNKGLCADHPLRFNSNRHETETSSSSMHLLIIVRPTTKRATILIDIKI